MGRASEPRERLLSLGDDSVVGGKYRLCRRIARGGQGVVWVAQHLQLDVPVAVKFLSSAFASDPEARARFEREARAAARLRTAHVVRIYDHGIENATPYMVMELLEGEDLATRLERRKRISLSEVARISTQTARGLERAHEAGLVHRDLKPGNLFLARGDEGEIVKILDFGVAKAARASMIGAADPTSEGLLLGSPRYMSPEQARGSTDVDHRSDLWSLAVIMFRAITGVRPFDGVTVIDAIVAICNGNRAQPSDLVPGVGTDVDRFFDRALAADPADRFQSATEMASEFEALLAGREQRSIDETLSAVAQPVPSRSARFDEVPTADGSISISVPPPGLRSRLLPWAFGVGLVGSLAVGIYVLRPGDTRPEPLAPARDGTTAVATATEAPAAPPVASSEAPAAAPTTPPPTATPTPSPKSSASNRHRAPAPTAVPAGAKKKMSWGF